MLDVDAVRAVTRLIDRGFEAYLVGGCVRDLLLDRTPKDYDLATEARPPQIKRTFPRNCRIIGRRFKLAHLHFHGNTKILECSTFRRTPEEKKDGDGDDPDLLITRDNEFGTAEEDALRRDFTINALFLDPTKDKIVDHVNGLEDIEARVIRTIGDPVVRFREDPVRILRAAKFAGRLGFEVEKKTLAAMEETAEDLVRAAPPRVLEEILRLLRSGHAHPSFSLLHDVGALQYLIPVLGDFHRDATDEQSEAFWHLLEALDDHVNRSNSSEPPANGVLLAVLLYGAVAATREREGSRSASSIAEDLLGPLAVDLRLPRRDSGCLKRICGVQHRFVQPEEKRRFRIDSFVRSPYFPEALELFELRTRAAGEDLEAVERWQALAGPHIAPDDEAEAEAAPTTKKKRRRRRRRRDDDDEEKTEAPVEEAEVTDDEVGEQTGDESASDDGDAPRKKRRRRRRRRPAAEDEDATFPESEEPAPHGDALDPDGAEQSKQSRIDPSEVMFPLDPGAEEARGDDDADDEADDDTVEKTEKRPARKRSRRSRRDRDDDAEERETESDDLAAEDADSDGRAADADDDDADDAPRRPRRRRGRRGRGRGRKAEADDGERETSDATAEQADDERSDSDDDGDRKRTRKVKPAARKKARKREPEKRDAKKRRGKKSGKKGGSRDVDVVPRYRDRRGKVEVIEPVSLDLSAFDVELDPKRVPTFGSIVEGKGRPKRRGPRMPDKGRDEYKPPPPPGGPDAPPPPPPASDDSDTFGDW